MVIYFVYDYMPGNFPEKDIFNLVYANFKNNWKDRWSLTVWRKFIVDEKGRDLRNE